MKKRLSKECKTLNNLLMITGMFVSYLSSLHFFPNGELKNMNAAIAMKQMVPNMM